MTDIVRRFGPILNLKPLDRSLRMLYTPYGRGFFCDEHCLPQFRFVFKKIINYKCQ